MPVPEEPTWPAAATSCAANRDGARTHVHRLLKETVSRSDARRSVTSLDSLLALLASHSIRLENSEAVLVLESVHFFGFD